MDKYRDEILEPGEKNIFEEFYELIEKHRLSGNKDFMLGDFYDKLTEFDQAYQKFNTTSNGKTTQIVNKYLVHSLTVFLVLFKFRGFSDRPLFYAFKRFIEWFSLVLNSSGKVKSDFFFKKNLTHNFPNLWNNQFVEILRKNPINFNLFKPEQFDQYLRVIDRVEEDISIDFGIIPNEKDLVKKEFFIYGSEFSVQKLEWENQIFVKKETNYEMTLDIQISVKDNDGSKLVSILNMILASIANVDNVKIEIEHLRTGSLLSRIKIWMKDLVSKEESKALMETAKEGVVKAMTGGQVSHSEVKKSNAETDKIKSEQDLLKKELKDKPSDFEAQMSNALDLEKKALENEKLKIELTKEKIALIEKLSDLAKKGILEADDIRIDINEVVYLLKNGNQIEAPNDDIDDIT